MTVFVAPFVLCRTKAPRVYLMNSNKLFLYKIVMNGRSALVLENSLVKFLQMNPEIFNR